METVQEIESTGDEAEAATEFKAMVPKWLIASIRITWHIG